MPHCAQLLLSLASFSNFNRELLSAIRACRNEDAAYKCRCADPCSKLPELIGPIRDW